MCLDSDILISFLQGRDEATEKIRLLKEGSSGPLRTTVVNVYELMKGARLGRENNESQVKRLVSELEVLDLNVRCCELGASLYNELRRRGSLVNEFDILIAGIVVENGETLVSRDGGYSNLPGLKLAEW